MEMFEANNFVKSAVCINLDVTDPVPASDHNHASDSAPNSPTNASTP